MLQLLFSRLVQFPEARPCCFPTAGGAGNAWPQSLPRGGSREHGLHQSWSSRCLHKSTQTRREEWLESSPVDRDWGCWSVGASREGKPQPGMHQRAGQERIAPLATSGCTFGSVSLPRGWSDAGSGFLQRWPMPQTCQNP